MKGVNWVRLMAKMMTAMSSWANGYYKNRSNFFKCRREFRTRRLAARVSQPRKPNSDDSDNSDKDYVLELNTYDGSKLPDSDNRIALFAVWLQQTNDVDTITETIQHGGSIPPTSTFREDDEGQGSHNIN